MVCVRSLWGNREGFKAGPTGCTCAFGLVLVAPQIQRRRHIVGSFYVMDKGHWSAYNHATYAEPETVAAYERVDPAPRAVA